MSLSARSTEAECARDHRERRENATLTALIRVSTATSANGAIGVDAAPHAEVGRNTI